MATQVSLKAEARTQHGKGPSGRLRKTGRIPAILYGTEIGSIPCHVDTLEMYHALRTPAGSNVLIRLEIEGQEHLSIVREIQRHAVRGDLQHIDFQNVSRDQLIPADIPVHLENEEDATQAGAVVNLVLHTVPILVKPLETPTAFTLDLAGLEIGDVLRVEDLVSQLPEGATFEVELDETVVSMNAPMAEEAVEGEEEAEGELAEAGEAAAEADEEADADE